MNEPRNNILDGCSIVDAAYDVSGYNYYRFERPGTGSGLIMREKTDETEYRYFAFSKANSETAWSNKTTNLYGTPSDFSN